ncbi:Apoptotic ATPase [Handroanthus impetiginosus]|uniref:Apoptotic ATPase n=1 Tax=Handroanthus impetiginosus TaxID=429701 RepID=A0A2G9HYS5_9LAMI|nr:Apoptotic ATPase [Handroanthus impetiginosus]
MAYFAAVISLKKTIQRLLNSAQLSILPTSQEILEFALNEVRSFQEVLQNNEEVITKNCDNERVTSLKGQITEAAYKLEDALESHALDQYESPANEIFLDFEEVKEEINYFAETMKKIEKMMMEELSKPLPEEEEEEDVVQLKIDGGKNSKMVGLSNEFDRLRNSLSKWGANGNYFLSIFGMAGIGKTTFALKLFEDPLISSHFDTHVFVTIGPKYQSKRVKVMRSILNQINHDIDEIHVGEDENLADYIFRSLKGRRCLIVFDDVWNEPDLSDLLNLLPRDSKRCQVWVTSRLRNASHWFHGRRGIKCANFGMGQLYDMHFLNKEESWDLLCEKVFGEGYLCPFQLEKFGKKIAEHCEGLPLTIITVANILSKKEKTLEYWEKVAKKETSVFTDAYDQMRDVLILSYNYLPQYLKSCFLYLGAFPLGCKIPASKLRNLWHAEQFLEPHNTKRIEEHFKKLRLGKLFSNIVLKPAFTKSFEDFANLSLAELVSDSIVLANQRSSTPCYLKDTGVKTCCLHSVYWHLCVKEARKEVFLHVINYYDSTEGIKSQRRLCSYNNVLFGIKEVHSSMESISMARSLLCTGPHHPYPVPICYRLRLLRVLDALTIRFYKFPIEVLKLVQLRYLALTYSGKVPGSISKLWNLEYLIVHRHLSINKFSRDSSYLPMEIWNMKELRHIQVRGGILPDPCAAVLQNLLTLSDVSVNSCSQEILERTPNLKKLGIQIELTPDAIQPLYCFDHFSHLCSLESLKCVIVNPKPSSQVVASCMILPSCLRKLSLGGLGCPWECMVTIAKLPLLKVLKLRCYAFQGPVWETFDDEFFSLQYLLLEDIDLVHWRADGRDCFRWLNRLIIRHCYKLKEVPSLSVFQRGGDSVELVDCPSLAVQLAEEFQYCKINVHSSLDDEE